MSTPNPNPEPARSFSTKRTHNGLWPWIKRLPWPWSRTASWQDDSKRLQKYHEAQEFRRTFKPCQVATEYEWASSYAERSYDLLLTTFESLDEKAHTLINYLGGGTAVITIGAIASITRENAFIVMLLIPAVLCALRAIYLAIVARRPTAITMPPTVKLAVDYVDRFGDQAKATFLGQWHEACEGMDVVITQKATLVDRATRWYYRALICLLIPFAAAPLWKLTTPSTPPKPIAVKIVRSAPSETSDTMPPAEP